jgi:hypothetical protein
VAVPCRLPSQRASYGAEPTTRQYPREVRSNAEGLSRQGRCGFAPFSAVDRGGICGARWNCPTSSSSAVFDGHSSAGGVTDTSAHLSQRIRFTAFARGEIATGEVHRLVDRALDGAAPELAAVHMRCICVLADFHHVEAPHRQQRSGRSTTRHGPRVSNGISAR